MLMRYAFAVVALFMTSAVYAGGIYDGIWQMPSKGYHVIYESDGTMLIVTLEQTTGAFGDWKSTGVGTRSGNTANLTVTRLERVFSLTATFDSPTSVTLTFGTCTPLIPGGCTSSATDSVAPPGTVVRATKLL